MELKLHKIGDNTTPSKKEVGGKGYHLFELVKKGYRVPKFIVLDQVIMSEIIEGAEDPIRAIDDFKFSKEFLDKLKDYFEHFDDKVFAVRSSAVAEDGDQKSFAGQFESYLYVEPQDIINRIKNVFKSIYSKHVTNYISSDKNLKTTSIAVIIQEMIDPDVSGVGFGINPTNGKENSAVVSAVFGVGEGLVSGNLNADQFEFEAGNWMAKIADKKQKAVQHKSGEISYQNLPESTSKSSTLSQQNLNEILVILRNLEKDFGAPQDIEFGLVKNEMILLQTRPITSVHKKNEASKIVWDNSNIVESYPGVTTPLTFSYIQDAYKKVYIQLAEIMGANKKIIQNHESTFGNMLGYLNGRVYYNLLSWYKILAIFPGYSLNARFMENMMGVKERFDLPTSTRSNKIKAFFGTLKMILNILYRRITIKSETRNFYRKVEGALTELQSKDLSKLDITELIDEWHAIDDRLTKSWKAPLINDSFAMIYFGRLTKSIAELDIKENPNLHNDLLCGSRDIVSVEPIHRLLDIAENIQHKSGLKEIFTTASPLEGLELIRQESDLKELFEAYLKKFGDRCVGELKLETISYNYQPELLVKQIQSFVRQNIRKSNYSNSSDEDIRLAAESLLKEKLKGKPFKLRKLKRLIAKARYFVSNRENLRYERTRVFGITRAYFLEIGKKLTQNNVIEDTRDIFYLRKEEISQYNLGTVVFQDLKSTISQRKKEHAEFRELPEMAERIVTYGPVHVNNDFFENDEFDATNGLEGIGCCPGIVKAKVRVVHSPDELEDLNGDILVTTCTDPGWVTLFPSAGAIIVERGSLLSHSAIVSREMGIPCIVGVTGLLKTLKTGDIIEMNGSTGKIKILE